MKVRQVLPLLVVIAALVAGCTPSVLRVQPSYQPLRQFHGGSGSVVLAVKVVRAPERRTETGSWILGTIRDKEGNERGKVVSDAPPEEIALGAFADELEAAGYQVEKMSAVPPDAAKGVRFSTLKATVNEKTAVATSEAEARLEIEYELVRQGKPVLRQIYQVSSSRTGVRWSGSLPTKVFEETVREAVRQGVPVILKELEKRD